MTRDVATVAASTPVVQAVRLLAHGLEGLPVVDGRGAVVGLVTSRDLMTRLAPRSGAGWRNFLEDGDRLAREYRRRVGITVGDVMTTPVASIGGDCPIDVAAGLLSQAGCDVLAVVDAGRVNGLITRREVLACMAAEVPVVTIRGDAELVDEMRARMAREVWSQGFRVSVHAQGGVVTLWGLVEGPEQRAALEAMARSLPGCRDVDNHLVSCARDRAWV
jgi:CBS domain-containing protein